MFGKLKGAFLGVPEPTQNQKVKKFPYARPKFLGLTTEDELQVCSDHSIRPILVPRDLNVLPWSSGYAETINAGKSARNEDQASAYSTVLSFRFTADDLTRRVCDMLPDLFTRTLRFRDHRRRDYSNQDRFNLSSSNSVSLQNSSVPLVQSNQPLIEPTIEIKNTADVSSKHSKNENFEKVPISSLLRQAVVSEDGDQLATNNEEEKSKLKLIESTDSDPLLNVKANDLCEKQSNEFTVSNSISLESISFEPNQTFAPNEVTPKSNSMHGINSVYSADQITNIKAELPFHCFALFDGHAGADVAVAAANQLHRIIQQKILNIADLLVAFSAEKNDSHLLTNEYRKQQLNSTPQPKNDQKPVNSTDSLWRVIDRIQAGNRQNNPNACDVIQDQMLSSRMHWQGNICPTGDKRVTVDNLITGALESAFWDFDYLVANDKTQYRMYGGCTAIVCLFILGKLYVANAGDSRAIMIKDQKPIAMSFDFTPESERERLKYLGLIRPDLLGEDFTHLEFIRRPSLADVGKNILYRDAFMSGWAYKTVTLNDLKFPVVYGEGKRSRALATIGVTRGFGDHELRAQNSNVYIKPFLSPEPEIRIYDIENDTSITEDDVIVMGTDGLWDVTSNEKAAELCTKTFQYFLINEETTQSNDLSESSSTRSNDRACKLNFKYRYISAAQDLVMFARGKSKENNGRNWKTAEDRPATVDDISVFVIPLKGYRDEYLQWKSKLT